MIPYEVSHGTHASHTRYQVGHMHRMLWGMSHGTNACHTRYPMGHMHPMEFTKEYTSSACIPWNPPWDTPWDQYALYQASHGVPYRTHASHKNKVPHGTHASHKGSSHGVYASYSGYVPWDTCIPFGVPHGPHSPHGFHQGIHKGYMHPMEFVLNYTAGSICFFTENLFGVPRGITCIALNSQCITSSWGACTPWNSPCNTR